MLHVRLLLVILMLLLGGCEQEAAPIQASLPKTVEQNLLSISRTYQDSTNVMPIPAWALAMCRPITLPHEFRRSKVNDQSRHARKLYMLYTNRPSDYIRAGVRVDEPIVFDDGFFIVKESWVPERVEENDASDGIGVHVVTGDDGHSYKCADQSHLFMMTKLSDAPAETTDNGWVYGIVEHDGSAVIESGRIESCMNCHKGAATDRLFGLSGEDRESLRIWHADRTVSE